MQDKQEQKVSWDKQEYQRVPWLRVEYGKTVLPQRDQRSNCFLANDQVLQPRTESQSFAKFFANDFFL